MKRWQKVSLGVLALLLSAASVAAVIVTRKEAHRLLTNPVSSRRISTSTPASQHLAYDDAVVTTQDGLRLVGWFIPATGHSVVIVQHGYKDAREQYLGVAALLHRHGFAVLIPSVRAHDRSDGEQIFFGAKEMLDLDAWYRYLRSRQDVGQEPIGILGVSMGGSLAIEYAAQNPAIKAIVADSAFSSLDDTVSTSVKFFTGLPAFPFAPMIAFWMERDSGVRASSIDAKKWIATISPRPVFLMQGGADTVISPQSGELLLEAAGPPKELWFEPSLGHAQFFKKLPEEFERRVAGFFDKYLIGT